MDFDETYYKTEIQGDKDHPHFLQRALWIKNYIPSGSKIFILGCGFGHTVYHLRDLGVDACGIESSDYAFEHRVTPFIIHAKAEEITYEPEWYVFSWNMLDCMNAETVERLAAALYNIPQMHIVCCSGDYDGYYIREKAYWDRLFNNIIDYENPESVFHVPTSWGKVSHK